MKKFYYYLFAIVIVSFGVFWYFTGTKQTETISQVNITEPAVKSLPSQKKKAIKTKSDKPGEFLKYFQEISTKPGQSTSGYKKNYRFTEYAKAQSFSRNINKKNSQAKVNAEDAISRGPGNVGGRTRAIVVDPSDATNNTWFAGAASGGIWKTTNAGTSWTNLTPDLPNLATNSIAMSTSNTDVIYIGTGELYAANYTFVRGDGVFKSTDKGLTWTQLLSTATNNDYNSVNRIVIDPTNEDIVIVCTNTGIYKTIDGGISWEQKLDSNTSVQDLDADPTDFNILYAGVNSNGIFKSVDAGETWTKTSNGITTGERFELAISPSNTNKIYTSTYSAADETIIYKSLDKGANWALANITDGNNGNFLGEQGWYDNVISVHPYDEDIIYVGGVYVGKYITTDDVDDANETVTGIDLENTDSFLAFTNFGQEYFGGALALGDTTNFSVDFVSVEVRFGSGVSQKAHRFTVPSDGGADGDGGAGIPDADFTYQDYVDVPFEVWDIENNRQLMVSFRDQQADGGFNLNPRDDAGDPNLLTSREYFYVHDIAYEETADADISSEEEGHIFKNMYFFWPVLASDGATFPPTEEAIMRINFGVTRTFDTEVEIVSDSRGDFGGKNSNLHADHHNLTIVPIDENAGTFRIVNGNDGGLGLSDDEGETWTQILDGYVTTQFYGADKRPGEDQYLGGMQDNGTWVSPEDESANVMSQYDKTIGGDGFEVVWHAIDPTKVMGSIYNNRIYRSLDGGQSFDPAQTGINTDEGPFITRLASSKTSPDVVFAVSSKGVLKTTDFGGTWDLIEIAENWTTFDANGIPQASSQLDIEVSLANDQVIWAGTGMSDINERKLFVSTDGGDSFNPVVDYPIEGGLGVLSGLATHPSDENTAYALFSFAAAPKVLKTTDLGQTWTDISGFVTNESTSSNGFPDVLVHSLLVLPNDSNVIWVGTEIGIFESIDGGATWALADIGLPSVATYSMKVVDDQVVIGTHGRGIWTITIPELTFSNLNVRSGEYLGNRQLDLELDLTAEYESVNVFVNEVLVETIDSNTKGITNLTIETDPLQGETLSVYLEATIDGEVYTSATKQIQLDYSTELVSFTQDVADNAKLNLIANVTEEYDSIQFYLNGSRLGSTTDVQIGELTVTYTLVEAGAFESYIVGYYGTEAFQSESLNLSISTITGLFSSESISEFNVYPNPAESVIKFDLPTNIDSEYTVKIMNSAGQEILHSKLNSYISQPIIDVSQLETGIYIIKLYDNNRSFIQRFIKE